MGGSPVWLASAALDLGAWHSLSDLGRREATGVTAALVEAMECNLPALLERGLLAKYGVSEAVQLRDFLWRKADMQDQFDRWDISMIISGEGRELIGREPVPLE